MRSWLVLAALLAAGGPAAAVPRACQAGAQACRDAFGRLEECRREHGGKADLCQDEKSAADRACQAGASACDDSSRRPRPRRQGHG